MDQNPYREGHEQAAEYLRLTITLLANNNIPASPMNYRMGYDYVAGSNDVLKKALDELTQQPGRLLSEYLWTLYQRSYIHNNQSLDAIREELKNIITSMQRDLERSGGKLCGYVDRLSQFADILNNSSSPQAIAAEVQNVIVATRDTEQSHATLMHKLPSSQLRWIRSARNWHTSGKNR